MRQNFTGPSEATVRYTPNDDPQPFHTSHRTSQELKSKWHPVLDPISEPDPRVDRALKTTLDQLYSLSVPVATVRYQERVSGSRVRRDPITWDTQVIVLQGDYDRARNHRARFRVLAHAREMVAGMERATDSTKAAGPDLDAWRKKVANDTRPIQLVEAEFGVNRGTISKWRKKYRHK